MPITTTRAQSWALGDVPTSSPDKIITILYGYIYIYIYFVRRSYPIGFPKKAISQLTLLYFCLRAAITLGVVHLLAFSD